MIPRAGVVALRALLAMVDEPQRWRSSADLAAAADLPAPFLEQLLLRLRRRGLLEARRGRHGGYRLHRPPSELSLAAVLAAVEAHPAAVASDSPAAADDATGRVTDALQQRLRRAMERELQRLNLEDLHHDLRSSRAALGAEGGLLLG